MLRASFERSVKILASSASLFGGWGGHIRLEILLFNASHFNMELLSFARSVLSLLFYPFIHAHIWMDICFVGICGHLNAAGELRAALLPDLADKHVEFFVGIKLNRAACC